MSMSSTTWQVRRCLGMYARAARWRSSVGGVDADHMGVEDQKKTLVNRVGMYCLFIAI
jgi:hypothetical protein